MIGQEFSLPFLIPLALERLEQKPLVEGDYYPGDLLSAVLGVDEEFWTRHPDWLRQIRKVVRRVKKKLPKLRDFDRQTVEKLLAKAPRSLTE